MQITGQGLSHSKIISVELRVLIGSIKTLSGRKIGANVKSDVKKISIINLQI